MAHLDLAVVDLSAFSVAPSTLATTAGNIAPLFKVAMSNGLLFGIPVTEAGVTILAESAEFAAEIDVDQAKADAASEDPRTQARGRARLRALGQLD